MPDQLEQGRHRRPWALGTVGTAAALVAAGIALWATGSSAASGYRTTAVTTASVRQTLGVSGTADPVNQATADFQVAGTVSAVDVAVGQQVTAGQALATLDTTTLAQDVSSAQQSLASAQAKLTEDEEDESSSSTSASDTSDPVTTSTDPALTSVVVTAADSSGSSSALSQAQQAVVTAQQTADSDSDKAAAAVSQAETACATSDSSTSGAGSSTSSTTTTTPAATSTTAPTSTSATACTTALAQALTTQQQVTTDQKAVASAESTLAQLLASSSSTTGSGSTGSSSSTGSSGSTASGSTGSSDSTGSGSDATGSSGSTAAGSTGGSTTDTDSAQQLASDESSIDSAQASLVEAQQALADAQLTSPLAGTVASVDLAVGQSVTAGSTTDAVTIINSGSYQVTASLTSAQAPQVKTGDQALVTVDGRTGTLTGTVARVGPVDTSSSSDTYPLIVDLPAGSNKIAAGSTAQVQVVLRKADGALVVPTSAVHTVGTDDSYVLVLRAGQEVRTKVTVGVVGSVDTQITAGVAKGQTVVLANLSEAVPTSSTATSTGSFGGGADPGGGSGFTGGGGFGGG